MEFDKSRVYTAVNADELKIGSKVIVADTLASLKEKVTNDDTSKLICILSSEDTEYRFHVDCSDYALAYLVEGPDEKYLIWEDLDLLDMIQRKGDVDDIAVVTRISNEPDNTNTHICAGGEWLSDEELKEWEKVDVRSIQ